MGIRGFYSYVQEFADASLAWHKLRNCKLVIDGNNLAHEIYSNSPGINSAFGGDYDKYATHIETFFKKLSECNVEPIVVMDGGYPMQRNKFKTVLCRLSDQMETCGRINPDNQDSLKVFPLMARSVFVCTIHKLGVKVLQADFEADDEIVVVAKDLGAYVLSNDSDFYIFDVPFILLHSVNMKHVQKEETKEKNISKFIPCHRFDVEKFCTITGVRRELMPLLAPLLGNDYVNPKCMCPFYKSISNLRPTSKKIGSRKKIIISVLKWLANQKGTPEEVLDRLINSEKYRKYYTKGTRRGLRKAFEMYFPSSSYLTPWISQHEKSCSVKSVQSGNTNSDVDKDINLTQHFLGSQSLIEELRCTCKCKSQSTILSNGELPDRFIRAYRLGLIPHSIVDLLTKDYFFTVPQIEVYDRECLYITFVNLIKDLRALLWVTYAGSVNLPNSNVQSLNSNTERKSSEEILNSKENNIDKEITDDDCKYSEEQSCDGKTIDDDKPKNQLRVESEIINEENPLVKISENSCDFKESQEKLEERKSSEEILNSKEITDDDCKYSEEESCDGKTIDDDEPKNQLRVENEIINEENSLVKISENSCDFKENQEKLEVCFKEENIGFVGKTTNFQIEKSSINDEIVRKEIKEVKNNCKHDLISKLMCDNSTKSIQERHHKISENVDVIATLKMNYYDRSKKNNFSYYDMMNMNYYDTSANDTLNMNDCDTSGNDISSVDNSDVRLVPETHSDCDKEETIPNANDESFSDDSEIGDDGSVKEDEDEEYVDAKISLSDDDDIDLEGEDVLELENNEEVTPFKILYIPPMRMFYRGINSFKVKHFEQEEITLYSKLPSLFEVQNYSENEKFELFYKLINFKRKSHTSHGIEFLIICISFWKKFFRHTELNNVLSLLVCIIMFYVIDGKLGRQRYKRSPEEVMSFQRKINNMKQSGKLGDTSSMSVDELIDSLTKEECKLAAFYMNNLHILDTKVDRKNYDRSAIHSFNEFQATVYFLQYLNSLLYFPFPVISMDSIWSGTFCYNVYNWLNHINDVNILLATLFAHNERMGNLYVKLYSLIKELTKIPGINCTFNNESNYREEVKVLRKKLGIKKIPTKKEKKKKVINKEEEEVEYSPEELLILAENRFAALSVS